MRWASAPHLLALVESYFQDHLQRVRGASHHTVRAFQDSLRLFFTFLADRLGRPVDKLGVQDIRAEAILGFLDHIESERGNSAVTRNCRLAALRSFAAHLLRRDITHADQYRRILAIPSKRARRRAVSYLEPEEMRILLAQPDRRTAGGRRDYALLLFLYNTGARVAEALGLRRHDLQLERPRVVRLRGKGGKQRICPLWGETVIALRPLVRDEEEDTETFVFRNARGGALSRDGVAYLLEKYVRAAAKLSPGLGRQRVTPHVLRHSCAVGLLQAGNDLTVVRDFLGHASIATTNIYVSTNLRMKADVLSSFWKRAGLEPSRSRAWQPTPKLMAFLTSLGCSSRGRTV